MTNELYEVALSEDGTVYGPFEAFKPGDVRLLSNFAKFRVTVFGDFAEDEYRLRGFSGIVDEATTSTGGFGISPFGKFPFGDGGVCLETSGIELEGRLRLSGTLEISNPNLDLSGTLAMSGDLSVVVSAAEAGSLALSGALSTVATNPAAGVLAAFGETVNFTGTQLFSITTFMSTTTASVTDDVSFELPIGITITSLYVILRSNVTGGQTFTAQFLVDGVASGAITVTIPAGSRVGSATGVLVVNAGQKLAISANSTGTVQIQAMTAGYFSN